MKFDTESPCKSCPYRCDAKLGLWHPSEFDNLAATERSEMGAVFACHGTGKRKEPSVCAGWMLDQQRRGFPSIALRHALLRNKSAVAILDVLSDGGHELYGSVQEMIEANESLGRCGECGGYLTEYAGCLTCA